MLATSFFDLGVELFRLCDTVDQTAFLRLLSADKITGDEHLKRCLTQNVTRERYTWRGAEETKIHAANGEFRRTRRDGEIAHGHELTTRGSGDAVNASDHGHWQTLHGQHHF
jgi:hypothetical protein